MGLAGGLVKKVFSKNRSPSARDASVDKNRWSLSRLSFCGDDFDSVHAEVNDLASLECSELMSTQQTLVGDSEKSVTVPSSESTCKGGEGCDEATSGDSNADKDREGGETKESGEEFQLEKNAAALTIQSAFRRFLAKRQQEQQTTAELEECQAMESPSKASLGTSVEVQVGEESVKNLPIWGGNTGLPQQIPHKVRKQTSKLKEEWDDSPVSSNISKLRVQKRLEAMTRRERALAYAFSQQLRVCSNKKKQARHEIKESNMSWTWLERWMATRRPECPPSEDDSSRQLQRYVNRRPSILRRKFDVDLEESCGSNDVPMSCENSVIPSLMNLKDGYKAVKNRLKAPKDAKRRINTPRHYCTAPPNKVIKSLREMEKEKQKKTQEKETGDLPA